MKMVSTRGVKFKFHEGEKVLCYEPDPTKAKVLYDSKVLEQRLARDDKGKKVAEYLIHFNGWNSSWDRYVPEEFILKDTSENRLLQQKLAEEAAMQLKNKKKRQRFVDIFKRHEEKKIKTVKLKSEPKNTVGIPKVAPLSIDNSFPEELPEKQDVETTLDIPKSLKHLLEVDCCFINKKKKLIKLPCEPNVVTILEGYVRYFLMKLLTTQKSKKDQSGHLASQLNLCKEVADGLRIYFDFTLPHILLYAPEKKQYECFVRDSKCSHFLGDVKPKLSMKPSEELHLSTELHSRNSTTNRRFKSRRSSAREKRPCRSFAMLRKNKIKTDLDEDNKNVTFHRILRSSNGNVGSMLSKCRSSSRAVNDVPGSPVLNVFAETDAAPLECGRGISLTSKSIDRKIFNGQLFHAENSLKQRIELEIDSTKTNARDILEMAKICPSSPIKQWLSSESTHLIHETLMWSLIPLSYRCVSFIPSLVYGAQHLLRLFVKLPELLAGSIMNPHKAKILEKHLQMFLNYLEEKQADLFHESVYCDPQDEIGDCDFPCVR